MILNKLIALIAAWRQERIAIAALRQLDERQLRDIGIRYEQIEDVAHRAAFGAGH